MEKISAAAELWLRMTEDEFWLIVANIDNCIHSDNAARAQTFGYASATDARLAMLRLAYLKGKEDASSERPDFDADVKRIVEKA